MASLPIPEEAVNHLGAMLLSFNRDISVQLLDEAEELASQGMTTSAVIISGTVLEYLERSPAVALLPDSRKSEFESWRRLRQEAVHASGIRPDADEVRRMLQGIREIVSDPENVASAQEVARSGRASSANVKGKYAHVRTSADEFMRRKRQEVELEDHK